MLLLDAPRTVFDFTVYGEAARQRTRRTVAYVALLLLGVSLGLAATLTLRLGGWVHREVVPQLDKIPVITVENGQASANVPQPWVKRVHDREGHDLVLIIDTTGRTTSLRPGESGLLLMKEQLVVRDRKHDRDHTLSLSRFPDGTLDVKALVSEHLSRALWTFFGVVMGLLLLWSAAAKLLQALLLALVGRAGDGKRVHPLSFGTSYTLSLYALTPAILLHVARVVFELHIPAFFAMYFLVAGVYVVMAHRSIPDLPAE